MNPKVGFFGEYGGQYIPETLVPVFAELTQAMDAILETPAFQKELAEYYTHYIGRPSPLYHAKRLTKLCGGAQIFFKRDELEWIPIRASRNCRIQTRIRNGFNSGHGIPDNGRVMQARGFQCQQGD